jgi:hypothetical protein
LVIGQERFFDTYPCVFKPGEVNYPVHVVAKRFIECTWVRHRPTNKDDFLGEDLGPARGEVVDDDDLVTGVN